MFFSILTYISYIKYLYASSGVPRRAAEITPVEPDPGHAGEGSHGRPDDELGHRAGAGAPSGAGCSTRRCSGDPRRLAARDRGRRAPRAGALAPRCAARDPARRADRQRDARQRGADRCGRTCAGMVLMRAPLGRAGSYARDGAEHAPVRGLGDFELIIIATAAAALSDELIGLGAQWFWTLVFGAMRFARADGPDLLRPYVIRRFAV